MDGGGLEGQIYLVFVTPQSISFPNDGIRYQEPDNRYSIPAGSSTRVGRLSSRPLSN
jgi:hypothetical protein